LHAPAATVSALLAGGARVVAWDSDANKRAAFALDDQLSVAPLDDLSGFDALVVSPGVPLNHIRWPPPRAAGRADHRRHRTVRAGARELPSHRVVGITGTNGKSTTTALIHHILKTAGVPT
jgi:UDP-N-acetylmuramoylalanine--D-glutamate ligase